MSGDALNDLALLIKSVAGVGQLDKWLLSPEPAGKVEKSAFFSDANWVQYWKLASCIATGDWTNVQLGNDFFCSFQTT